ncbi:MAG: hypothetical protein ACQERC_04430 [Bacteroidota bacterium]
MKWLIVGAVICFYVTNVFAQTARWSKIHEYKAKSIHAWDVDPMGKVVLSQGDVLTKLDTSFAELFSQSTKQFGDIAVLDARHSLKTLVFSEDQQVITFVDNTLTFQDGTKDLTNYEVDYATNVCYSNQTNRFWVYDGDNARLLLIDERGRQNATINNLTSITQESEPELLFEQGNELLLFYPNKGIYLFDYYGSLMRFYPMAGSKTVYFDRNYFYFIKGNEILRIDRTTDEKLKVALPVSDVNALRVSGSFIFLEVPHAIQKYRLQWE